MQIVIDIDENVFTRLFDNGTEDYEIVNDDLFTIAKSIRKGTPLNEVLDKIKADIEKAMEDFYYDEHDLGVRAGFRFALEIIDNHISGKEQE